MRTRAFLAIVAACFATAPWLVCGDAVVYSTIDPNTTTYSYTSNFINYPVLNHPSGSPPGVYQSYADEFVPTSTFTLSSIVFGVRTIPTNNFGDLKAIVYANDPATNLPLTSAPLATATAVAPAGNGSVQTVPLTTFDFSSALFTFISGQIYWIALEPGRDGTDVDWGYTTNNTTGRVAENLGSGYHQFTVGGATQTPEFGAFRINAVPEPSSFGLLIVGAILITSFFRCRNAGRIRRDLDCAT
jgi:hypothetical protein